MLSLLPSKSQWRKWSKPTKYQFVGMLTSVAALFVAIASAFHSPPQSQTVQRAVVAPQPAALLASASTGRSYDRERADLAVRLGDASTCLAARLYRDSLFPLESDCQMQVQGLGSFFKSFAPLIASIPYSGAEDAEMIARWTEGEVQKINSLRSQAELLNYQKVTGINLAQVGYYLCGLEWYLRNGPPEPVGKMEPSRVALYQATWVEWNRTTASEFQNVPFLLQADGSIDDPNCQSFVDVVD